MILYEDDDLIAVDKPAGVVVHPTYKNTSDTVLDALQWRARDWPSGGRPSIVGRIDKLTSGIVVAAKSAAVHAEMQRRWPETEKHYLALVFGRVEPPVGAIDLALRHDPADRRRMVASETEGAPSRTTYARIAHVDADTVGLSLLRCTLATGRTHQIRVHLAASGWPIVGDAVYGEPRWTSIKDAALRSVLQEFPRQALHAWRVALTHPTSGERLEIEAPVPADLAGLLAVSKLPLI